MTVITGIDLESNCINFPKMPEKIIQDTSDLCLELSDHEDTNESHGEGTY